MGERRQGIAQSGCIESS